MNYVKYFKILGVNTTQIPCIELQGVPNTATEGAVGLLGINVLSEEHELYKCVEVKGNVYTWMPIKNGKDGISIIKTELNDNCELIITFSDGTQTNLGVIKGEKGEKGEQADLTKIKEKNEGKYIGFWSGNTEAFEDLETKEDDTWYLLEDDTTLDEIDSVLTNAESKISEFDTKVKGLEVRTKKVEEAIPLVEDEISDLQDKTNTLEDKTNTLEDKVGLLTGAWSIGNENTTFDLNSLYLIKVNYHDMRNVFLMDTSSSGIVYGMTSLEGIDSYKIGTIYEYSFEFDTTTRKISMIENILQMTLSSGSVEIERSYVSLYDFEYKKL